MLYQNVCICVHTHIYNLLSPFNVACHPMTRGNPLGLDNLYGILSLEEPGSPSSAVAEHLYSSSSMNETMWDFPVNIGISLVNSS